MQLQPLFGNRVRAAQRDPADPFWYGPVSRPVAAGVSVTVQSALTLPVVYDCLQVLSQTVGALPFAIFDRQSDGSKIRRDDHPLMVVLRDPNPETSDVEFFGQMVFDIASDGNFFAEIRAGRLGPISELWRHEPGHVTVERVRDGSRRYVAKLDDGSQKVFTDADMWHVKVLPHAEGGLRGMSPIHAGREAIGAALALQSYAARFFANDCTPPFVLEHPTSFKDDISRDNFLGAIKRWWSGTRRHSPGLLEHGMKLNRVGVNNEEAQFLETRNALDHSCARIWRMPPHKVGLLDKATNNNIEHQALEFVTDTLLPWLRLIEKSIIKHLIIASDRFIFEFNVAGLLRGDLKARYEAYAQGRQWGWLSVNDIRKLENQNPIKGGDIYLQPLNMVPVGTTASNQGAQESKNEPRIYAPNGDIVSRIYGGNIIRMTDYRQEDVRNAA
ncbi:MAG: phage portal protein [Anaerolineaceae bacterium]|nr:MAG: phage portal protein [Anaerolineaceae bacterium]